MTATARTAPDTRNLAAMKAFDESDMTPGYGPVAAGLSDFPLAGDFYSATEEQ